MDAPPECIEVHVFIPILEFSVIFYDGKGFLTFGKSEYANWNWSNMNRKAFLTDLLQVDLLKQWKSIHIREQAS